MSPRADTLRMPTRAAAGEVAVTTEADMKDQDMAMVVTMAMREAAGTTGEAEVAATMAGMGTKDQVTKDQVTTEAAKDRGTATITMMADHRAATMEARAEGRAVATLAATAMIMTGGTMEAREAVRAARAALRAAEVARAEARADKAHRGLLGLLALMARTARMAQTAQTARMELTARMEPMAPMAHLAHLAAAGDKAGVAQGLRALGMADTATGPTMAETPASKPEHETHPTLGSAST